MQKRQTAVRLNKLMALACTGLALSCPLASDAVAQTVSGTEQYQELFIHAGYSALFGAALGTAVLPFIPTNSVSNLRVIAGGASIGFVAGSIMALYNMRQQQSYGLQYYPEDAPMAGDPSQWQWDLGTTNGNDLFVRMDSRF